MPFDFPSQPEVLAPEKTLKGLAFALRHHELWPREFKWDYTECKSCAMGLAVQLWNLSGGECTYTLARAFSEDIRDFDRSTLDIFCGLSSKLHKKMCCVTPEDVADALDEYLAA